MIKTGNFRPITNELTGEKEYNLDAKLIHIGSTVLKNSNDNEYKIATIEFEHPTKGDMQVTAQLFAKSEAYGLEKGNVYLTNMSTDGEKTYFRMSHLPAGGGLASADLFNELSGLVEEVNEGVEANA